MKKKVFKRNYFIIIGILAFFTVLIAVRMSSFFYTSDIIVSKVIDGDTIVLSNGSRVRYIGIDTPEPRKKNSFGTWIYDPEPFAEEATKLNKQLVEGKKVRLEFDVEKRDKYGRLLAYVFVDDIFVNARLIEEGTAVILTIPPNVKYSDQFKKLQEEARKSRKGMWATK